MWSSLHEATAPAATAVAAAPIGLALCARVLAAWRAAHIFIAFETSPYSAAVSRLLSAAGPSLLGLGRSAARETSAQVVRRSAEARESLLRPSELHRRSRAAVLAASCGKLFSIWRQDGVVDASSGVVHASL